MHPKEHGKMENIFTVNDVAKKLKMSTSAIYKMAESGRIPSMKIGSCRRFTEEQIAAFLLSCNETGGKTGYSKPDQA
jgi:excisionase family DNA binding protein